MRRFLQSMWFFLILLFLINVPLSFANDNYKLNNLRFCCQSFFENEGVLSSQSISSFNMMRIQEQQSSERIVTGLKSYKKALLLSGIFPGAGEIYLGSYKKGIGFGIVEVMCWALYISYNNKGDEIRSEFRDYADVHWSKTKWRNGLVTFNINEDNLSHHLPEEKDQQYYEMIGKYNQFAVGWDDCNTWEGLSENRLYYEGRRYEHNKYLKRAINMTSIVLLNRVASFIDTIWGVKTYNKRIRNDYQIKFGSIQYTDETIPTASLIFRW